MNNKLARYFGMLSLALTFAVVGINGQSQLGGGRLAGTWEAVVTLRTCDTGTPTGTINSIANFDRDGTSIGSTGGIPQAARTPEHGVWRHVRGNLYRFKFKTFSFLPTGAPNGWTIVEHELELDPDNNSYTSAGTAKFYSTTGGFLEQRCSSAVGTRFEL